MSRTLEEPLPSVPELCFDVTGAGGAVLHLLLLLLPQDALGQQVVGGCDVVVLVGLQSSESTVTRSGRNEGALERTRIIHPVKSQHSATVI